RRAAAGSCGHRRSRPTSAGRARTTRRSGPARGRRRPRTSATTSCPSGRSTRPRAHPRSTARRVRAAPRPRTARRSGPPVPRRACAGARPGTTRRDRPRPRRGSTTCRSGRRRTSRTTRRSRAARAAPPASASHPPACSARPRRGPRGRRGRSSHRPRRGRRSFASPGSGRSRSGAARAGPGCVQEVRSLSEVARRMEFRRSARVKRMQLARAAGIFLHPTSLPGGRLGDEAYRFVDWLQAAGQSWWQVLPLGPPDEFGSPYRAASAFAASPLLLAEPRAPVAEAELEDFVARHPYWIGEWARFAGEGAIADQVRFEREWSALRAYARERGVRLLGDVPIYVADGGADVEAWPELFEPTGVAGAPPDALSADGQLWGNPLYDWPAHRATGYRWWIERFRRSLELVDMAHGEIGALAAGPGPRALRRGPRRARRPAARRRGPRRDHPGGLPAARRARAARHGRAAVGVRAQARQPARACEPAAAAGRLHLDARHRHRGGLVRVALRAGAARDRPRPGGAGVEPDRARARVAREPRDRARAGPARAREPRAHEPSGARDRKLGVAARARRAQRRAGRASARGDGARQAPFARSRDVRSSPGDAVHRIVTKRNQSKGRVMKRRIRWILPLVVATAAAASLAASHAGATPKSDGATATPIKHLVVI